MSHENRGLGELFLPRLTPRKRWQLRWPRLAVLRLEGVLAWVLVGSGGAWLLAPWFVGDSTQQIGSAYDYMAVWLALSLGVACYWVYLQWRDRPALPPRSPLGLPWSVAANFTVMAALFSVVPVAGQAAEHHIRSLRRPDELLRELSSLRARAECEAESPIGRWGASSGWPSATRGMSHRFWRDHVVELPLISIDSYLLPPELQEPEKCLISEELLHRYLADASLQATLACLDGELDKLSGYSLCRDAYLTLYDDPEDAKRALRLCGNSVLFNCNKLALTASWRGNFSSLLLAHNIEFRHSTSTDPDYLLQLGFLAMLLAIIAGCAGVFQTRLAGAVFLVLALLVFLIPTVLYNLSEDARGAAGVARVAGILGYVGVMINTSVSALTRRARSDRLDLAVILVCIGPLFIPVVEARIDMTEISTCPATVCQHALWPFPHLYPYAMLAWTAIVGSALSWYRTLPNAA